jgi:hypothetical protein
MTQSTRERWDAVLAAFEASGLSAARFCAGRGIALSTFYAVRRAARGRRRRPLEKSAPAFVEAVLTEDEAPLVVECRGGRRIIVARGFDGFTLRRLIAALEHDEMPGEGRALTGGGRP